MHNKVSCHVCSSEKISNLGFVGSQKGSVTSDSRLCRLSARIFLCEDCGLLQKLPDEVEASEIGEIYSHYTAHYLSSGVEQLTFVTGQAPKTRTHLAFEKFKNRLPKNGKLLDIGAGNGAVLKSANSSLSGWELYAYDVSDHCRDALEAIPNVKKFTTDLQDFVGERFDVVVLWHTLEHVFQPSALLAQVKELLAQGGHLLIQVPDIERNFFDLGTFDHVSHFSQSTLLRAMSLNGFTLDIDGQGWFHNCLTGGFVMGGGVSASLSEDNLEDAKTIFLRTNQALENFSKKAVGDFAVFGTSQAALLTLSQIKNSPQYFIDEDPNRIGNELLGKKVCSPREVSSSVKILIPFVRKTAEALVKRLVSEYKNLSENQFIYGASNL